MPAYNEGATIGRVIETVLAIPELHEIIIVDDASTDETSEIASEFAARNDLITYVKNDTNLGKTGSLIRGFGLATGTIIIPQDADLEYDPTEIPQVIAPILEGRAQVAYGTRVPAADATVGAYYLNGLANRAITFVSNTLSGLKLADVQTCYIAFTSDLVRNMIVTSTRFGFEVEATAKVAKLGVPVAQVPVTYRARRYDSGKKLKWTAGFAAIWNLLKYNLFTSRKRSFRSSAPLV